jgi:hypothetical protein
VYAWGPHADLVGAPVPDSVGTPPVLAHSVDDETERTSSARFVPALVHIAFDSPVPDDSWVAIAVDGIIAGVGPVYGQRQGQPGARVIVDPSMLETEPVETTSYLIDEDGQLQPIELGT